jgi:hypothetical protein
VKADEFKRKSDFTWTADATTMEIPDEMLGKQILRISDDTDTSPGPVLRIWDEANDGSGFYTYDHDTWGWYPAPSSDRSLVITYVADCKYLREATDEPDLIPRRHRDLIIWSAAIWLHQVAPVTNTKTLGLWLGRQDELRFDYHKELARGSPAGHPPPHIRNPYPDINEQY